jgi:pimeloyl-ACP methyl ester carboxylesterase
MATFVLVHGAWMGGEIWKPIARPLRAAGHEVYAPTLTGVGARSHLLRAGIDLDTHIADVVNLIKFYELRDIVLYGHSYGGMVVTGAADAVPDQIASLVYLDAFVPENGQSLGDLVAAGRRPAPTSDGIAVMPLPPAAFGLSPQKTAVYEAHVTPQPVATMTQKLALTGGIARIKRRVYIYANDPQPTGFTKFYERFRNDPAWEMHTLPCTHLVQLDMPDALIRILLGAAPPQS